MIRISAKPQRGFYRAGVFHSHTPTNYPDDHFTKEQLEALKEGDMLTVQYIEGDPENAPPPAESGVAGAREREEQLAERESAVATREEAIADRERKFQKLRDRPLVREGILRAGIQAVVEAKQDGDFTKAGEPTTEAVEREAPGMDISAAERSQWFAELYPGQ